MTIIAWDGKTLAADRRSNNCGYGSTVTKLFRIGDTVGALSGDGAIAREMLEWFKAGAKAADFPTKARDDISSLIVVSPEGVLSIYTSGPYSEIKEQPFIAFGSGRDFALTALHLGKTAREAVEIACLFDNCCGNGIDTLELNERIVISARDELISAMVNKFLGMPLPTGFEPDCGISFKKPDKPDARGNFATWPVGTNLFSAEQAREMFDHCLPQEKKT